MNTPWANRGRKLHSPFTLYVHGLCREFRFFDLPLGRLACVCSSFALRLACCFFAFGLHWQSACIYRVAGFLFVLGLVSGVGPACILFGSDRACILLEPVFVAWFVRGIHLACIVASIWHLGCACFWLGWAYFCSAYVWLAFGLLTCSSNRIRIALARGLQYRVWLTVVSVWLAFGLNLLLICLAPALRLSRVF
jgi:hypothetical protein